MSEDVGKARSIKLEKLKEWAWFVVKVELLTEKRSSVSLPKKVLVAGIGN